MEKKAVNCILEVSASLVLALFILSFSVAFTLHFRPLYYMDIGFLGIEGLSGMSREEIKENYDALIDYNSMFSKEELVFPTLPMSQSGKVHFEEVKVIFVFFQKAALLSFLVGSVLIFLNGRKENYGFLKLTGILTIVIPAAAGLLVGLNWDWAFVKFHELVFQNDYWIFDASTDPVILILPDAFFLHCAVMILVCIVAGSFLCFGGYKKEQAARQDRNLFDK